jgi:hypothetical protein
MIVSHAAGPGRGGWEEQLAGPDDANFSECFSLAEPGQTRSGFGYGSLAFPFAEWSRAFRNPTPWGSDFSHRCEGAGLVTGVVSWVEPSRVGTGPVPVFCVVFPFSPSSLSQTGKRKEEEKKGKTTQRASISWKGNARNGKNRRPVPDDVDFVGDSCDKLTSDAELSAPRARSTGQRRPWSVRRLCQGPQDITTQDTRRK